MKNILIATFSFRAGGKRTAINGMVEPLLSFFLPKVQGLTLLDGAHPGSDTVLSFLEQYHKKELKNSSATFFSKLLSPLLKYSNKNATQIAFKIRDFFDVLEAGVKSREKFDLFIGLESIYTLSGIMLKRLGKVNKVIYYVSDYSPNRYSNIVLNSVYLWLDRFCCYNADFIWDVSPAMMPARIKAGLRKNKAAPLNLVPNALFDDQISYLPVEELEHNSLVYLGTLGDENGPQVAISAMPEIIKQIPKAHLHIIGGPLELERPLRELVKKLSLERNVTFHGFIHDAVKVSSIARRFMIGLAPYLELPGSARWYADATKIRLYMGVGLPTITTHVPPLGKEIEKRGAGIITKDNPADLAKEAILLLKNRELYLKMRENALNFAKNNTWKNSYKKPYQSLI